MTAAFGHEYEELHRLVDRLPIDRVRALRTIAVLLAEGTSNAETKPVGGFRRRLSFTGIMDAEPDLAARSEDILREELGHRTA